MQPQAFEKWLAAELGQDRFQIQKLLKDPAAVQFLMAWSMLEAGCFQGFAKGKEIFAHADRLVTQEQFDLARLSDELTEFHGRYQDKTKLKNLMHGHSSPDITPLLSRPLSSLSPVEKLQIVLTVVYRYRNNIFHGTKGVDSWLRFKPQIGYCISAMQVLISHARARSNEPVRDAA